MYKKFNIATLVIVFAILLSLIVLVYIHRSVKGERTFSKEIIQTDTSDISAIIISSAIEGDYLRLYRSGNQWMVMQNDKSFRADAMKANEILNILANMKPERVAAINDNKWKDFDVSDSTGILVKIEKNKKIREQLMIGRFSYQQPPNTGEYNYYYQQRGRMLTYVRRIGDKSVYIVDGFLRMTFTKDLDSYRDKTLIRGIKDNWTKITFSYPADESFVLEKRNGIWAVNFTPADSNQVLNYLRTLENLSHAYFVNEEPQGESSHKIRIEGNNMPAPIELIACPVDTINKYTIRSSMNPDTWFSGAQGNLFDRVFVSKNTFIAAPATEKP